MSRLLWMIAAVTMMALCWGSVVLGVGSVSMTINQDRVNANLCQVAPEFRYVAKAPAAPARTAKSVARPA